MRTGILGGTFDPIHRAHINIAIKAYEEFGLDKVLFMPSPNPPHKNEKEITDITHRINMIKLVTDNNPKLEFSDFELSREGKVYSADTLTLYKSSHPEEELFFIMGSDSLYSFDSWYKPEVIVKMATILVACREDNTNNLLKEKIEYLRKKYDCEIHEIYLKASNISSTMIRQNAYSVELSDFVPDAVADYIISNNLYKTYIGSKRFTNAQILDDLQKSLKPSRYEHTLSVANTARELADTFGENPNKAYLAGLLHDCAKCIDDEKSIEMCKNNNIELSEFELNNPALVHAKLGAFLAQTKYHIIDEDIINAIAYHTTGRPDMSLLEKIIFVADYIEPLRTKQPYLSMLRECAFKDLDYTIYRISEDTLEYLKKTTENENQIDTNTKDTYLYYKNIVENR